MNKVLLGRKFIVFFLIIIIIVAGVYFLWRIEERPMVAIVESENGFSLPPPHREGGLTVEDAIRQRRSRRDFTDEPLTLLDLSLICWAGQGVTELSWGLRAAPSAGATYPLTLFLVVGEGGVVGIAAGIYEYLPETHTLRIISYGDQREPLRKAALNQIWVGRAPVTVVIVAEYSRTTKRYGERGEMYVDNEVGCVAENIYLQVESLNLGTVLVGAFDDNEVQNILSLDHEKTPCGLMPIGHPEK